MHTVLHWIEAIFASIPLPLLEVWGRVGYVIGFFLAICAFTGFTFRTGQSWALGRERQAWDAKALLSVPLTFVLIIIAGYVGSFIVLVPGAQTFESLKDLVVFLCILLFGYPALITVPFAYGLSDLIEGVPPEFLVDWLPGYFINPACFWVAYQLIGKNPDFRRAWTWGSYLVFVLIFMAMEPVLWGFICSDMFSSGISYRSITPALFFTTSLTWVMAPFAMLGALPLARRSGLFWAEIAGHVKERKFGHREWLWEAGKGKARPDAHAREQGMPIRMFIVAPFIAFVLLMVGVTAYVTLRSAEDDATKLATRLHQEIAENINLKLDDYLAKSTADKAGEAARLLKDLPLAKHGRAFIIDRSGGFIASSADDNDPVVSSATITLRQEFGRMESLESGRQFRFDHVSAKPLSRQTWLAQATAFQDKGAGAVDWIVITAMPEAYYLAGVRTGTSRSAMVVALTLLLALAIAATQASMVSRPLQRLSRATLALARGNLAQRLPRSRLDELDALTQSFNDMTRQLKKSFDELVDEVERRKQLEQELRATQAGLEQRVAERTRKLATTTAFLDALVDHMPNPVFYKDADLRYAGCNRAYEEAFGVKRADLVGKTVLDLGYLPEADRRRYHDEQKSLLDGAGSRQFEASIRFADGRIHQTLFSVGAFRRADESPGGLVGVLVDITPLKDAQAALAETTAFLDAIVDHIPNPVFYKDAELRFLGCNRANEEAFGLKRADIVGKTVLEVNYLPETERQKFHDEQMRLLREGGTLRREVAMTFADGRIHQTLHSAGVFRRPDGSPGGVVGVLVDITSLKETEAALEKAKHAAEHADRLKSAFLATMSHELRTPLNSIIGFTGLVLQELPGPLNDEQKKQLGMVRDSARHLLALINDVLDISKIEAGELVVAADRFDFALSIGKVVGMVRPLAEKKGLALSASVAKGVGQLVGDARRVEQILLNLLSNAIKFTETGSITLTVEPVEGYVAHKGAASCAAVRLRVTDTGIGIKPEDMALLFRPFRQIDSALSRSYEGTGLGLAICSRLAGLMGGRIEADSIWRQGSVFSVTLPLDRGWERRSA